jgi:hypothetical protein
MMVAIGLGVTLVDLLGVARNAGLVARAALASYVCIPLFAVVGSLLLALGSRGLGQLRRHPQSPVL